MFNINLNIDKVNKIISIDIEKSPEFLLILFLIFCFIEIMLFLMI